MSAIQVGRNIARLRKARGLTQEGLASLMGVSKASVSKWETAQSYPDIELLPQLATYFGVTLDELVGYEPQLSRDEVRSAYRTLRDAFASEPFDKALEACRTEIRAYYSCYPLLLQIATLYLNYLSNAPDQESREMLVQEALDLVRRVREESAAPEEVREAASVESMFLLSQGRFSEVVALLGEDVEPDYGTSSVLAAAYGSLGQSERAAEVLQSSVYQGTVVLLNDLSQMALGCADDLSRLDKTYARACAVIEAFDMEHVYMNCAAVYLSFAQAFMQAGKPDRALEVLARYVDVCARMQFPLKFSGDAFFDRVGKWFERLGAGEDAPRDAASIKKSMVEALAANPGFAPLAADKRFTQLQTRLEKSLA